MIQSRKIRHLCTVAAFFFLGCVTTTQTGWATDPAPPPKINSKQPSTKPVLSGPTKGHKIRSFFVRAVTGPHRNRSICYVCRYGNRPVIMVLLQEVDRDVPRLLKSLDKLLDSKRATGLRGFGVLVTDDSSKAVPILQTMAFDQRLQIPLVSATTAIATSGSLNLNEQAATTIVLYNRMKTIKTLAFRKGELNSNSIKRVLAAASDLIEPSKRSAKPDDAPRDTSK